MDGPEKKARCRRSSDGEGRGDAGEREEADQDVVTSVDDVFRSLSGIHFWFITARCTRRCS